MKHAHDVMAAILIFQNSETAAIFANQTNPVGVQLSSYGNTFFCCSKFAWVLDTLVHVFCNFLFCNFFALMQDYYVTKTFLLFPEAKVSNRCVLNDNGQKSKQNNKEFWLRS